MQSRPDVVRSIRCCLCLCWGAPQLCYLLCTIRNSATKGRQQARDSWLDPIPPPSVFFRVTPSECKTSCIICVRPGHLLSAPAPALRWLAQLWCVAESIVGLSRSIVLALFRHEERTHRTDCALWRATTHCDDLYVSTCSRAKNPISKSEVHNHSARYSVVLAPRLQHDRQPRLFFHNVFS